MIAQIVNGAMATKKALQKQPRINKSRAESMCLLQESALTLLLDHDPDALTIREIAELAGLPHRYIPHYFGGKAELFASIYPEPANQPATKATFPFAGALANQLAPEITRHARLAIWLSSKHPSGIPKTELPIQKQLTQTLKHQFNLDKPQPTSPANDSLHSFSFTQRFLMSSIPTTSIYKHTSYLKWRCSQNTRKNSSNVHPA